MFSCVGICWCWTLIPSLSRSRAIGVVRLKRLDKLLPSDSSQHLMGLDGETFRIAPFNVRTTLYEKIMFKSHADERKERIYVHYTNVSQINHRSQWQIIIKRWKTRKYCRKGESKGEIRWTYTHTMNGAKSKDWKQKLSHFYWSKSRFWDIKSIEYSVRVSEHKFNLIPSAHPQLNAHGENVRDWNHFWSFASDSPVNCSPFFIIEWSKFFYILRNLLFFLEDASESSHADRDDATNRNFTVRWFAFFIHDVAREKNVDSCLKAFLQASYISSLDAKVLDSQFIHDENLDESIQLFTSLSHMISFLSIFWSNGKQKKNFFSCYESFLFMILRFSIFQQ